MCFRWLQACHWWTQVTTFRSHVTYFRSTFFFSWFIDHFLERTVHVDHDGQSWAFHKGLLFWRVCICVPSKQRENRVILSPIVETHGRKKRFKSTVFVFTEDAGTSKVLTPPICVITCKFFFHFVTMSPLLNVLNRRKFSIRGAYIMHCWSVCILSYAAWQS